MRDRFISVLGVVLARFGFSRLVGTAAGVAVTAVGVWWVVRVPPPPVESTIEMATTVVVATGVTIVPDVLIVHVAGEVVVPGVYELAPGSRLVDALEAAGGPTPRADVDAVNLASPVGDAEQVFVPRRGAPTRPSPSRPSSRPPARVVDDPRIDLNTASAGELDALPGIGPQTAEAIVEHRTRNGPFLAVDELLDVRGIGPAKLAALRDRVRV